MSQPSVPFMWGFSSSSYQYEDPAVERHDPMHFQTDWDLFYLQKGKQAPRAEGIGGWSDFGREIAALQQVGASHYRFSVEWARVEPRPGVYNETAIAEYVRRARALRAAGITPVVCLWHFTFPAWATDLKRPERHGWLHPELQQRWGDYVTRMVESFGDDVSLYAPQNEPNNVARGAHLWGVFPPGQKLHRRNYLASMDASAGRFVQAVQLIRALNPAAKILSVQNVFAWDEAGPRWLREYIHHFHFRHLDVIASTLDYLGFNYFTKEPACLRSAASFLLGAGKAGFSDLGWAIRPDGLYQVAKALYQRYRLPLIVTENGVADAQDVMRAEFLVAHLRELKKLEAEGVPLQGYFHWSLADNYEWGVGFKAKFGIFSHCQLSNQLLPKRSARVYASIIRQGWHGLSPDMQLEELGEV
ncbi:MAG: family 1 glycosylhydrolase [Candidatus Sericytochromatia bacterium]